MHGKLADAHTETEKVHELSPGLTALIIYSDTQMAKTDA